MALQQQRPPETTMPTFVTLTNYTQDGIELLAEMDEDKFLQESRAEAEAHGGKVKDVYFTLGQYDAVVITEFPDAESATKTLLAILKDGIAETETLRAFTEPETRELIGSL